MNQIGERIKAAREKAGLTQTELGQMIGTTGVSIMRYEKGLRDVKQSTISKIAEKLNVSPAYLMGWTDEIQGTYQKPRGERIPTDNPDDRYPYLLNKELHGELAPEEAEELKQLKRLNKIAGHLDKLTECGQEEAVKRVAELTEIPKYRKPDQE